MLKETNFVYFTVHWFVKKIAISYLTISPELWDILVGPFFQSVKD
jgi:hypothetical protein